MADTKSTTKVVKAPVTTPATPVEAPKAEIKKKMIMPLNTPVVNLPVAGTPVTAENNHHMWYQSSCLGRSDMF